MKPGNLWSTQGAKTGGETKDEDSKVYDCAPNLGAHFSFIKYRKDDNYGKETVYF